MGFKMINTPEDLKSAISEKHGTQADFSRALMEYFPWRFTSLTNAQSWVSKKANGVEGMTNTDRMFFNLWFNLKNKKK
jgi:hypothetical protein